VCDNNHNAVRDQLFSNTDTQTQRIIKFIRTWWWYSSTCAI